MTIFRTQLMPHQQAAVDKLRGLRVGALYMDMGTGKTRVALDLALQRVDAGKVDGVVWLCPLNVKRTIADEIEKHCPDISYGMLRPDRAPGEATVQLAGIESLSQSLALNVRVRELVTSRRQFLVVDESALIKNHLARRTLATWRLGEQCPYRLMLNGTPISNNEKDLFAQWYFLDPRILGYHSYYSFAANHLEFDPEYPGRVVRAHNVQLLARKMAPYLYQVRKDECLQLPPKSYTRRYCRLSQVQAELYQQAKDDIFAELEAQPEWEKSTTAIYRLFTALQRIVSGTKTDGALIYPDPKENPRVELLQETVEELPPDAKSIIWCKYADEFHALRDVLIAQYGREAVAECWGEIARSRREREVERFRHEARFLLANRECAGYGLNLQHCQYAIYYSNTFAWATRSQSEDRLHRQGQTRNVHIIDLVCEQTIDERIQTSLARKENLVEAFRREIDARRDVKRWLDGEDA